MFAWPVATAMLSAPRKSSKMKMDHQFASAIHSLVELTAHSASKVTIATRMDSVRRQASVSTRVEKRTAMVMVFATRRVPLLFAFVIMASLMTVLTSALAARIL